MGEKQTMKTWKVSYKKGNSVPTVTVEAYTREQARYAYMKKFNLFNYCNVKAVRA